jgi:hypothetical protein
MAARSRSSSRQSHTQSPDAGVLLTMEQQQIEDGVALDAVRVAAIQKTEHYCIANWGAAPALAQTAEQKATVKALERGIKEGKSLDEKLTPTAKREINPPLQAGGDEDDEDADAVEGEEDEEDDDDDDEDDDDEDEDDEDEDDEDDADEDDADEKAVDDPASRRSAARLVLTEPRYTLRLAQR